MTLEDGDRTSSCWPTPARSRSSSTTSSRTPSSTTATAAQVTVELGRKGDAVTITVSDTGIGLTPEEAGKLFNEFTRIKNEQTVKILGSGLGLSTVRKIANMYDGEAARDERAGRRQHLHGHPARRAAGRIGAARPSRSPTSPPRRRRSSERARPGVLRTPPRAHRPPVSRVCEDVRY